MERSKTTDERRQPENKQGGTPTIADRRKGENARRTLKKRRERNR